MPFTISLSAASLFQTLYLRYNLYEMVDENQILCYYKDIVTKM